VPTEPKDFIIFIPDGATTEKVFNEGVPLHLQAFSLFFKQWTRLVRADAAVLPTSVELDLRGVPVHAWEQSSAQHVLSGSCLVESLHVDTAARTDLSVFHVRASRQRPKLILPTVALFIPDPVITGAEGGDSPTPSPSPSSLGPRLEVCSLLQQRDKIRVGSGAAAAIVNVHLRHPLRLRTPVIAPRSPLQRGLQCIQGRGPPLLWLTLAPRSTTCPSREFPRRHRRFPRRRES
jgi:hypothetical protein